MAMDVPTFSRMVDELRELDEKIARLETALDEGTKATFQGRQVRMPLPVDARGDLLEQQGHMLAYRDVLARRIAKHAKDL